MAGKCYKCTVEFVSDDIVAKCVECKLVFHPACTRVGSAQAFTKTKSKGWKCDNCNDESSSVKSNEEVDDKKSILAALKCMKKDIYDKIDSKIGPVQSSIDGLVNEFSHLSERLKSIEESQCKLDERCDRLERGRDEVSGQVRALQIHINDLEQHSRCANIELQGLPFTHGENIYNLLESVAKAINVSFDQKDVSIAHRLRSYSQRHSHPPVIVQFTARRTKEMWIRAARAKRSLQAKDVHPSLPGNALYINDHLTPLHKQLLGMARRLVREGKLHSARFINGKVLCQIKDGDKLFRITSLDELDKYDR